MRTNQRIMGREANISQVSNELEFNIRGTNAQSIIGHDGLPLVGEVNPENLVELNVSLANDADDLNIELDNLVSQLILTARLFGGDIYSGSSLIQDVSGIEPERYRTTCLSESCARGFLDITSQQIVIGVRGEQFGVDLFNYIRTCSPLFLALTNSSPYRLEEGSLVDTGFQSRRITSYENLCNFFPTEMLLSRNIESVEQYHSVLEDISSNVLDYLREGRLDANMEELCREREGGVYYPFETLEPHQIYWMTRFRPDHQNESSDFSIELRACDIPTTTRRMQAINSYVIGLCYYMENEGFNLPRIPGDELENLTVAARDGTKGFIGNQQIGQYVRNLLPFSVEGLMQRNCNTYNMVETINQVLEEGNCAEIIRRQNFRRPSQLVDYLVQQLEGPR